MSILLKRGFFLLYTATICFAVHYECDNMNTTCGCGLSNVELTSTGYIRGENAVKHSWPMIVLLDFHWSVKSPPCSGTILNNYFILTSAHCVKSIPAFYITIKAGIHYPKDENTTTRVVERFYLHPNYSGHDNGYANDIALLELSEPLDFDDNPYISPSCIPTINSSIDVSQYPKHGARLLVIGWQSIRQGEVDGANGLRQGAISLISPNDPMCRRSFIDPEKQFCAGFSKDGTDPCYGDAGGPLLQWMGNRWEQVGIANYPRCNIPGHPSIYTRLPFYIDWINMIIKSHNESLYITTTRNPPVRYICDKTKVQCGCGYRPVQLPASRIIDGEDAIPDSWSMIVSIRGKLLDSDGVNGRHICGGTILNEWYILTAAHCVDSSLSLYSNVTVTAGIHYQLQQNRTIRTFDRIILHPLWKQGKLFSNDIALLHLSEALDFDMNPYISRTCRPPPMNSSDHTINYPLNGTMLVAVGWGLNRNWTSPEILQQVDLYSIHHNDSACAHFIYDHEVQFCAGVDDGRKSACFGDSGGPILQWLGDRWEQVGITSYVVKDGCARRNYPPVFTRLASFYDWIEWNIDPDNYTTSTSTSTTTPTTATSTQTSSVVTMNSTTEQPTIQYKCDRDIALCGCGVYDVSFVLPSTIGGADSGFFRWTMIVSIRLNNTAQHSCAGTILTNRYILTSAHCVQNQSLWKITIVPRLYRLSSEPLETYRVDRIHQHPNYENRGKSSENDIALLHLTESLDIGDTRIKASTCVPKVNFPTDISQYPSNKTRLAIIGWGTIRNNQSYMSERLQQAEIFVIDNKDPMCSNVTTDPEKQFCTGFERGAVDTCPGDSGGPIFQWMNGYWDQVGIISSSKCSVDGQASVYTRLAYYYDWMMSIVGYDNEIVPTLTQINATKVPIVYHCNKKNVSCGCGYTNVEIIQSRIMNGENAVEASWSMFVSLRILNSSKHICGGTLLSNLHILTAAHCVQSFSLVDPSDLTIIAGITNRLDSVRYTRNIRRISIHPNFTDQNNTFLNDIAILELDHRLLIDSNPVLSRTCVPHINSSIVSNRYPINGSQLVVVGWGTTEHEQYTESDILQQVEVFAFNKDHPVCLNLMNDAEIQFCAGTYHDRKGPCQGDSGGPIFQWAGQNWEQVGIVSYGDGCTTNGSPQIYTRLSVYLSWINKVLNDTTYPTTLPRTTRPVTLPTTSSASALSTTSGSVILPTRSSTVVLSTTSRPNCALKHQLNVVFFQVFVFIVFISFVESCSYITC